MKSQKMGFILLESMLWLTCYIIFPLIFQISMHLYAK